MCWQQPLRLPGNLLAWMDDSIKLQGAEGRKKIGKDGENLGQEQCEREKEKMQQEKNLK